jgi:hypothetical protein
MCRLDGTASIDGSLALPANPDIGMVIVIKKLK